MLEPCVFFTDPPYLASQGEALENPHEMCTATSPGPPAALSSENGSVTLRLPLVAARHSAQTTPLIETALGI